MKLLDSIFFCLPRWSRRPVIDPNENTPIFPSPDTVLTPPRPRPSPLYSTAGHVRDRSSSTIPSLLVTHTGGKYDQKQKDKLDTISKTYGQKMHNINPRPSSSTPNLSTFPRLSPIQPLSPSIPLPHRSKATTLGRSQSEGASLSALGFTAHQIPRRPGSSDALLDGTKRRRNTTSRLLYSDFPSATGDEERWINTGNTRGRSPGPVRTFSGRSISNPESGKLERNLSTDSEQIIGDYRFSGSEFDQDSPLGIESPEPDYGLGDQGGEAGVVNYDLGLRELRPARRARRKTGSGGSRRGRVPTA